MNEANAHSGPRNNKIEIAGGLYAHTIWEEYFMDLILDKR